MILIASIIGGIYVIVAFFVFWLLVIVDWDEAHVMLSHALLWPFLLFMFVVRAGLAAPDIITDFWHDTIKGDRE